jgi:hypothetical protein
LSVAAGQASTKSLVTCATVASLEADDSAALNLFDQHLFHVIAKVVNALNLFKQVTPPNKEEHAPAITSFAKKLGGGLPS